MAIIAEFMEPIDIKDADSFLAVVNAYVNWTGHKCGSDTCLWGYDFALNIWLLKNKIRTAYLLFLGDDVDDMPFEIAGLATLPLRHGHANKPHLLFYAKDDQNIDANLLKRSTGIKQESLLGKYLGYLTPCDGKRYSKCQIIRWQVNVLKSGESGAVELYHETIWGDRYSFAQVHDICRDRVEIISKSFPDWFPIGGINYLYEYSLRR